MTVQATDVDHMHRYGMDKIFGDPDGYLKCLQLTPHNVTDIYDAIDVTKQPELKQEGKVVIVTGAGRGIGRSVAIEFAKANAKAIVLAARTTSQLEEVRDQIQRVSSKTQVHVQSVDVGDETAVKSLYDAAQSKFGGVDVVVSNAGAQAEFGKLLPDTDTESWWNDWIVNVKGTYLMAKHFAKALDGKTGTFINMSSAAGVFASPGQAAYCSNKAAGIRIIEELHLELPNLRSFNVHPGVVETQMFHDSAKQVGMPPPPLNWTMPALTGGVSLFLTTPRAEFLRGRFVSVNWRVDELEAMKGSIEEGHLLKSGIMGKIGV